MNLWGVNENGRKSVKGILVPHENEWETVCLIKKSLSQERKYDQVIMLFLAHMDVGEWGVRRKFDSIKQTNLISCVSEP